MSRYVCVHNIKHSVWKSWPKNCQNEKKIWRRFARSACGLPRSALDETFWVIFRHCEDHNSLVYDRTESWVILRASSVQAMQLFLCWPKTKNSVVYVSKLLDIIVQLPPPPPFAYSLPWDLAENNTCFRNHFYCCTCFGCYLTSVLLYQKSGMVFGSSIISASATLQRWYSVN